MWVCVCVRARVCVRACACVCNVYLLYVSDTRFGCFGSEVAVVRILQKRTKGMYILYNIVQ